RISVQRTAAGTSSTSPDAPGRPGISCSVGSRCAADRPARAGRSTPPSTTPSSTRRSRATSTGHSGGDGAIRRAVGYRRMTNIPGWHTYRTQLPLLALIEPRTASDLVRSIVAGFDESGTVAKWEYAGVEDGIMVGDPAAPIVAAAYAFGARQFDVR